MLLRQSILFYFYKYNLINEKIILLKLLIPIRNKYSLKFLALENPLKYNINKSNKINILGS